MATRPATAKKAAAKKPAVPAPKTNDAIPVVTLKAVFEQLGETHDLSKKQPAACWRTSWPRRPDICKLGAGIRMSGLGTLEVRARGARTGPQPGDRREYLDRGQQEGDVRPAKELKETV